MTEVPLAGLERRHVGLRVAVTGANGYLGRHLVQTLRKLGCAVLAVDIDVPDEPLYGARWEAIDVRDYLELAASFDRIDTVFHTAAAMCFAGLAPKEVADRVWSVNVEGTDSVLEACREAGVGRLVYTSSANVCIDREILEEDETAPYGETWVDLYGPSKAEAERRVLAANNDHLRTIALRPGGLWGPGDGGLMVRSFLEQLAAGRFVATIGDGTAVVDNTHIFSLIRAELLAARALKDNPRQVGGQAYFVTDDERINGIEWFRPIANGLGHAFPRRKLNSTLMYFVAWLGEVGFMLGLPEPQLTRIGVLKLTRSSAFKIDAARRDLGYEPLIGSADGIAAHLDDYRRTYEELRS